MVERIFTKLDGVKRSAKGYVAKCPAHEDKEASLSIGTGDNGKVLLKCFAGCTFEEIVKAMARRGDPVSDAYCNRELACLRHILRLAVEEEILEVAPVIRLYKEDNARDTALSG